MTKIRMHPFLLRTLVTIDAIPAAMPARMIRLFFNMGAELKKYSDSITILWSLLTYGLNRKRGSGL